MKSNKFLVKIINKFMVVIVPKTATLLGVKLKFMVYWTIGN